MDYQVLTDASGRVHVESARGHCILTIEGTERQDEGTYSVIVRNPAGEDTADIHVKVVGKLNVLPASCTNPYRFAYAI